MTCIASDTQCSIRFLRIYVPSLGITQQPHTVTKHWNICHLCDPCYPSTGYGFMCFDTAHTLILEQHNALPADLAKLLIHDSKFVPGANCVFIKLLDVVCRLSKEFGHNMYSMCRHLQGQEVAKNYNEVYRSSTVTGYYQWYCDKEILTLGPCTCARSVTDRSSSPALSCSNCEHTWKS